ncbi:MAG: SRPBCC family protein [Pseudomonadota bacterium]
MKLSTSEDIDAPIERVFASVSDFAAFERRLVRRGIDITRDESTPHDQVGAHWHATVLWRGHAYKIDARLVSMNPVEGYLFENSSNGVECLASVDLVALSETRTRLLVSLDLKPATLSARLLLQSLKLAKGNLTRRFEARVHDFAKDLSS